MSLSSPHDAIILCRWSSLATDDLIQMDQLRRAGGWTLAGIKNSSPHRQVLWDRFAQDIISLFCASIRRGLILLFLGVRQYVILLAWSCPNKSMSDRSSIYYVGSTLSTFPLRMRPEYSRFWKSNRDRSSCLSWLTCKGAVIEFEGMVLAGLFGEVFVITLKVESTGKKYYSKLSYFSVEKPTRLPQKVEGEEAPILTNIRSNDKRDVSNRSG